MDSDNRLPPNDRDDITGFKAKLIAPQKKAARKVLSRTRMGLGVTAFRPGTDKAVSKAEIAKPGHLLGRGKQWRHDPFLLSQEAKLLSEKPEGLLCLHPGTNHLQVAGSCPEPSRAFDLPGESDHPSRLEPQKKIPQERSCVSNGF